MIRHTSLELDGNSFDIALLPRTAYEVAYVASATLIGFALESQHGVHALGSDRRVPFRTRPNSLAYIPAGCDVYSQSNGGGEYLLISTTWRAPPAGRFNDASAPGALAAACSMRRLLLGTAADIETQLEDSLEVLLSAVVQLCGASPREPARARWMTARRLRLVDEMIEARIAERLPVAELARALGLSSAFFIRAFREATGRPPHDYIMECRVAHARTLLERSAASLASIAAAAGFASQAHMCTVFRRRLSLTPGALRARA